MAVTIFVNPLQFGPGEDFESYPRDLAGRLRAGRGGGSRHRAGPAHGSHLPRGTAGYRARQTVGRCPGRRRRPGHFDGVATMVTKLFARSAGPCCAYFGEKDYQQLVIVRRLVTDLSLPVVVVACPTVREPDGLALSSRNAYLSPEERLAATGLYWSLLAGKRGMEEHGVTNVAEVQGGDAGGGRSRRTVPAGLRRGGRPLRR